MRNTLTAAAILILTTVGTASSGAAVPKAEVIADASSSMKPFLVQTKEIITRVEDFFKKKGMKVELREFGKSINKLKDANSYKPDELDTNYAGLLEHLEKRHDTLAVIITDGRVPAKRLKDIKKIKEEGALLNDAGNVVCVLTAKTPTKVVKDFAVVAGSYKDYQKVLQECLEMWRTLHGDKTVAVKASVPSLVKTVNEEGFEILGVEGQKAAVKTAGAQVEVIIKTK